VYQIEWSKAGLLVVVVGRFGGAVCLSQSGGQCALFCRLPPPTVIRTDIWNWRVLGSCRARAVDCVGVIHPINPIPFNSTLASIGWSDVQIGLADGLLVGFGVMYGNEFRK